MALYTTMALAAIVGISALYEISECNDLCDPRPGHSTVGRSGYSCECLVVEPPEPASRKDAP